MYAKYAKHLSCKGKLSRGLPNYPDEVYAIVKRKWKAK